MYTSSRFTLLQQKLTDHCKAIMCTPLQSCLTLCNPMDCSPPGSSVHGILQARILKWVPCPPAEELSDPGMEPMSLVSPALQVNSLPTEPPGKPKAIILQLKKYIYILFFKKVSSEH